VADGIKEFPAIDKKPPGNKKKIRSVTRLFLIHRATMMTNARRE